MKRVITDETVVAEHAAGRRRISAPPSTTIITPGAWSRARELGVTFDDVGGSAPRAPSHPPGKQQSPSSSSSSSSSSAKAPPQLTPATDPGSAERVVDPSGVLVVRGQSVRLGRFTGAGPGKDIGLTDLVTGGDGSPMTAGIMSWTRDDSFPWFLDYDEVDLVLEGVLHITIDGRTLEGRAGDVFYVPKGSRIVFGTPNRVRVFYVTHPANWAGGAERPQR